MDPASHPALRVIGIAAGQPRAPELPYDVAREHDRFLADTEAASWTVAGRPTRVGRAKPTRAPRRATKRG